jgi:hypothetical protein
MTFLYEKQKMTKCEVRQNTYTYTYTYTYAYTYTYGQNVDTDFLERSDSVLSSASTVDM